MMVTYCDRAEAPSLKAQLGGGEKTELHGNQQWWNFLSHINYKLRAQAGHDCGQWSVAHRRLVSPTMAIINQEACLQDNLMGAFRN